MEATLELGRCDIGFSAAHFAVHDRRSERLHGHNYVVFLRARGEVGAEGIVVDFGVLKRQLRELCAALDERVLVPTRSPRVAVEETDDAVLLAEGDRRFVLPRSDVALLPIVNSTCECLAAHLLTQLRAQLGPTDYRLELRVEEHPGQGAMAAEEAQPPA